MVGRCTDCGNKAGKVGGIWYCPWCEQYKNSDKIELKGGDKNG